MPRAAICAFATLLACDPADNGQEGDATEGGGSASAASECEGDEYAIGLARTAEGITIEFEDASPAPPAMGNNLWVVNVMDDAGPLVGAKLVVVPTMPEHGHGTSTKVVVTELETPGQYQLDPLNLFMAGRWNVEIRVTPPEADGSSSVAFDFCIVE